MVNSVISNFTTAIGANEAAMNSAGSAAKEQEKYLQSIAGKVEQLKSSWEKLATTTIDSSTIKGLLDLATGIIKITDAIGGLVPLLGIATTALFIFKGGLIMDTAIKALIAGWGAIKAAGITMVGSISNITAAFSAYRAGIISTSALMASFAPLLSVVAIAITGVMVATNLYNSAMEASAQKNSEAIASLKSSIDTLNDIENQYQSLNESEKNEEEKKKSLIELQNKLNEAYANNNLNLYGDAVDDVVSKLEKLKQLKLDEMASAIGASSEKINAKLAKTGIGFKDFFATLAPGQQKINIFKSLGIDSDFTNIDNVYDAVKKLKESMADYSSLSSNLKTDDVEKFNEVVYDSFTEIKSVLEENKDSLDAYYEIFKSGEDLTADQVDQLLLYNEVMGEDIYQLDEATIAEANRQEVINDGIQANEDYTTSIEESIDALASFADKGSILDTALDEITNSGGLTAQTFQDLMNNNLLQYLELVNGKLTVNKTAFEDSAQGAITSVEASLKAQAANQILALINADLNGTLEQTASSFGLIPSAASNANSNLSSMVNAFDMVSSAGSLSTDVMNAFYKSASGQEASLTGEVSTQAQGYINQVINNTKSAIVALNSINLTKATSGGSSRKSSGGSSKSASQTAKEEYKPTIDWLAKWENALDIAKNKVKELDDALGNTDNFNEQENLIRQLIDATNNQINKTNDLKNAQTGQINNMISQLRNYGFAIDYNSAKNELYINNMERLGAFTGDTAKAIEKLLDESAKLNDDNASLSDSVRNLTGDIKDYYDQLADIPEQKLEKFKELLEDFQQTRLDALQGQIDDIQYEMKNDKRLQALNDQIDAMKKQSDEIDKQAELQEKLLNIEKAKIALENAQKQKNVQVYRSGMGWIWEQDQSVVEAAQEDLKSQESDLADYLREEQISQLEEERDNIEQSYQDKIDVLEKFLDEQEYLIDKANRSSIESFTQLRNELAQFGLDNGTYLAQATDWVTSYNNALGTLNETMNSLSTQTLYNSTGNNSNMYTGLNNIDYEALVNKFTQMIVPYTSTGTTNNSTITIGTIELPEVKNADDFIKALQNLPNMASSLATNRK